MTIRSTWVSEYSELTEVIFLYSKKTFHYTHGRLRNLVFGQISGRALLCFECLHYIHRTIKLFATFSGENEKRQNMLMIKRDLLTKALNVGNFLIANIKMKDIL